MILIFLFCPFDFSLITITTYSYIYEGFIELFSKQDLLKQKKSTLVAIQDI